MIVPDFIAELPSIILQNQVPKGMKASETLMQMEGAIKKYTSEIFLTEDDLYDDDKKQPPRFVTQIKDQVELVEMQSSKFECQLAPVGDPNMKVEWFFNGKPLHYSELFSHSTDFTFANELIERILQRIDSNQFTTLATWP